MSLPPQSWDYRRTLLCGCLGPAQVLMLHSMHYTGQAISIVPGYCFKMSFRSPAEPKQLTSRGPCRSHDVHSVLQQPAFCLLFFCKVAVALFPCFCVLPVTCHFPQDYHMPPSCHLREARLLLGSAASGNIPFAQDRVVLCPTSRCQGMSCCRGL